MVDASESETEPAGLTIDDLAGASKVPSRTIRFYQSKGLLPKPVIRGRVAFYDKAHLERLELIASLQDRGLRIEAIRDLVTRMDRGELDKLIERVEPAPRDIRRFTNEDDERYRHEDRDHRRRSFWRELFD